MLLAGVRPVAHVNQEAGLADQVFLLRRGLHSHFLLAVDYAPKVRLLALGALEKADFGFGKCSQVLIVEVARRSQTLVSL